MKNLLKPIEAAINKKLDGRGYKVREVTKHTETYTVVYNIEIEIPFFSNIDFNGIIEIVKKKMIVTYCAFTTFIDAGYVELVIEVQRNITINKDFSINGKKLEVINNIDLQMLRAYTGSMLNEMNKYSGMSKACISRHLTGDRKLRRRDLIVYLNFFRDKLTGKL